MATQAGLTPGMVSGEASGSTAPGRRLRVKDQRERYDQRRLAVKGHDGTALLVGGVPAELPSEAERAMLGSWCKRLLQRAGYSVQFTEHDKGLLADMAERYVFTEGEEGKEVADVELVKKALLDDSISGANVLNPVLLEDAIQTSLVLHSQLAPYCSLVDLPRGRIVRTGLVGRPISVWGSPPGTAIAEMDCTNLVGSIDTTIFPLVGAVEVSQELQDDVSAVNIGDMLIQGFSDDMRYQLDRAIAIGDGVSQPTGLFNTAGVTVVPSASGSAGPAQIADLEGLFFAVPKQYREPPGAGRGLSWVGNDLNYRRFRTIPIGSTFNERLWGLDRLDGYTLYGLPFRVQNDIPNNSLMAVDLSNYRLFRRAGIQSRVERGGKELTLKRLDLIVCLARFGGRLVRTAGAAKSTDLAA